jgi:hypothetical protein
MVLAEFGRTKTLDSAGIDRGAEPVALASAGGEPDADIETALARLLAQLSAGDYFAITAYVERTVASEETFAAIRSSVRDTWHTATTLGYGPRFLHSTGQLHKGGPPEGVFLQVTATDAEDIAIPNQTFTFGQLKRAQAIGDLQSLEKHGRPALRVHLGADIPAGLVRLRRAFESVIEAAGVGGGA